MKRKVVCSVCGKKGSIAVTKNKKIAKSGWNFFGMFMLNSPVNRDAYERVSAENEESLEAKELERVVKESRVTSEYWECQDCARDMQKLA